MIENVTYDSFFINIPEDKIPVPGTQARKDLRKRERARCLGGVHVDGVYIPGWLYWHINYWWLQDDIKDEYGNPIPFEGIAALRDNEWERAEALELCKNHPTGIKGYCEMGARQLGKTTMEASFCAYNSTLFKGSQNIVISGTEDDLGNIKLRLNFGLNKLHPIMRKPRLTKDKRAKYITLGYKDQEDNEIIWSHIITRNIAEGKNTEGPAGVTAKSAILDEAGKAEFREALDALKPAFISQFGARGIIMVVGTGGSFDKGEDAEELFYNPEANGFLGFRDEATGQITGKFMSGIYRTDCKKESNLAAYLISKGKIPDGYYPELSKIPMRVADEEKALKIIHDERKLKAADPNKTGYLKTIMYSPLTPEECFMKDTDNMFNIELANRRKDKILEDYPGGRIGFFVELDETVINGEKKIIHKASLKLPISSFPHKPNENRDAPIVILEHPVIDPPFGLYVAGCDPYNQEITTENSDSNGAIYIFKRMYDAMSDKFQDMPVAWYVARPREKSMWYDNARKLIKYYNAQCLCENDILGFIEYMIAKGDGHMMMDSPEWLREIAANSVTINRPKGISSANKQIVQYRLGMLKDYMEDILTLSDEKKASVQGIAKIFDPMFLEEIIKWNPDRSDADRVVALSIAITAARRMDKMRINPDVSDGEYKPTRVIHRENKLLKPITTRYQHVPYDQRLRRLMK